MSEHVFYSTENHYNERELTIVNCSLLVSKPPTKEKRIRIKVRMILSGQAVTGAPEWISSHHSHVAQWHDPVYPAVDFKGYDLHFSADNLFDQEGIKAPRCQMTKFEIHECGDHESPDIAMSFLIYAPFSSTLWNWLGQFGGDACFCSFTPGVPGLASGPGGEKVVVIEGERGQQEGEEEGEEGEEEEPEFEEEEEDEEADTYEIPAKSGPKELAAFHEQVAQGEAIAEVKRGRGRPRKNAVDPLTVPEPAF